MKFLNDPNPTTREKFVFQACRIIVAHCKNLVEANIDNFHTRLFEHLLHPEPDFVGKGKSLEVSEGAPSYRKEHIVPCAVMYEETRRLVVEKKPDEEIAKLLQRHWATVFITKEQVEKLDIDLGLKSTMPENWCYENDDPMARLTLAEITVVN